MSFNSMDEPLNQEEFEGILHQLLRFPAEYALVKAAFDAAGFTISAWLGVLCIEVGGNLVSAKEAFALFAKNPALESKVRALSMNVWK
ncbi:MAG: hypothetical protein EOP11_20490 [Proteobacteria bacterium]|nr:MAG: hypothetical protein EOP11_20490 [Pseudomonadota bacterium]